MGRVVRDITIDSKKRRVLFDSGSERSYIVQGSISESMHCVPISPFDVMLNGTKSRIAKRCIVIASIEGMEFDVSPHVIDDLGDLDGEPLDMIIGATAMEEEGIKLNPKGKLDLSGLKRRNFNEFEELRKRNPRGYDKAMSVFALVGRARRARAHGK